MNQILFPTDFSYNAQNAFYFVAEIAHHTNAIITMVHVKKDPPHPIMDPFTEEILEWIEDGQYDKCFRQIIHQVPPHILEEDQVKMILREGSTIETILEIAGEIDPDLIVMGTMGASGLKEMLVGSNTAHLIEHSKYNVLAVPNEATYNNFEHIACSIDLIDTKPEAIQKIIHFGEKFNSKIHCFHVDIAHNPLLPEKLEALKEHFKETSITFEVVKNNFVIEGINSYLEQNQTDLLVIYTHPYTFIQRLFQISYTKKLVLHTEVPVLAVRG